MSIDNGLDLNWTNAFNDRKSQDVIHRSTVCLVFKYDDDDVLKKMISPCFNFQENSTFLNESKFEWQIY